jgi:hypothetical protein
MTACVWALCFFDSSEPQPEISSIIDAKAIMCDFDGLRPASLLILFLQNFCIFKKNIPHIPVAYNLTNFPEAS